MIGRMELDDVAAKAFWIEGIELRRVLVSTPRQREHIRRAPLPAERGKRCRIASRAGSP